MASTFYSTQVGSGVQARSGTGVCSVTGTYELTAALVINDVIQMVKIPKGASILETILATDDLDTASSPAIVLTVGDDGDTDRFTLVSTIAQAGGFVRMTNIAGLGYQYTADNTIDVKCTTAPQTGATSGTISLTVIYDMNTMPT